MATKRLMNRKQHARTLQKTVTTTREKGKPQEKGPDTGKASAMDFVNKEPVGYEEAVLRSIMGNSKGEGVPDEAFMLSTVLSNMSEGMKQVNYRHGISLGRALYKVKSPGRGYMLPEESVVDLVEFFQNAGHKAVSFTALPGNDIEIRVYDKHGPRVGAPLHAFEAGIISGFLSSVNHRYVNITEKSCVNGSGAYCRFSENRGEPEHHPDGPDLIGRIVEHVAESSHAKRAHERCIKNEYYLLETLSLFDPAYIEHVKDIATYVGKSVGDKLDSMGGRAKVSALQNAIRLLNFGTPAILATKPMHIRLHFNRMNSRREFIEMSLAFINGLLSNSMQNGAVAVEHSANGSYVIDIKERKSTPG